MKKLSFMKIACGMLGLTLGATMVSGATTTFTTLANFNGANGAHPHASLIQATDGSFYGTTYAGGTSSNCANGCGTIFKISPAGTLTTVYNFCLQSGCADGASPFGGLLQAPDGNFYGTTVYGGAHNKGTVFKMTPGGTLNVLHSFAGYPTDGANPYAGLLLGNGGNFYGTTKLGGAYKFGTVFSITPTGTVTILNNFDNSEGAYPYATFITEPNGGYYYGATPFGGPSNSGCQNGSCGILFKITSAGKMIFPHNFKGGSDGAAPYAPLSQGSNGKFYGVTYQGGTSSNCSYGCGTVFNYTNAGEILTTLHSFVGYPTDGALPSGAMVQATDGNFYGTTIGGGAYCATVGCGSIFKMTPTGTLTMLHSFTGGGGSAPAAGLLQGTDGNFYGTTNNGGTGSCSNGCGTIFKMSVGLLPFVTSQTYAGEVGNTVILLGSNLTGTDAVSFNGTPATGFTVVSPSEITTTVPAGATTGKISVTTPSGTLKTNTNFNVRPQVLSFTPSSGSAGTAVQITGVSLTQTSVVTFDGVKATSFTVNSDTEVTAIVPSGAKTGVVSVSTAGGFAWSPKDFTVQ